MLDSYVVISGAALPRPLRNKLKASMYRGQASRPRAKNHDVMIFSPNKNTILTKSGRPRQKKYYLDSGEAASRPRGRVCIFRGPSGWGSIYRPLGKITGGNFRDPRIFQPRIPNFRPLFISARYLFPPVIFPSGVPSGPPRSPLATPFGPKGL